MPLPLYGRTRVRIPCIILNKTLNTIESREDDSMDLSFLKSTKNKL
jgi:hypothetical protein